MNAWILARRNLRLFFRDRAAVSFSLLSAFILVGLYVLFLGNLQVQTLSNQFPNAARGDIDAFVEAWVFAGITMFMTLTTGLAALSTFVEDAESGRFSDFLVAPIRRSSLVIGYMFSSFIVAVTMTFGIFLVSLGYAAIRGNQIMSLGNLLLTAWYIVLSAAVFSALSGLLVSFLKTNSAFAAASTIVGTLVGFLAGAYIPVGALPSGVVNFMNTLPFAQSAALIRQPFTAESAAGLTSGDPEALSALSQIYGLEVSIADFTAPSWLIAIFLLALTVTFVGLGALRMTRRIR